MFGIILIFSKTANMKQLLTFAFVTTFFLLSAQEIDRSFGEDGFLQHTNLVNYLEEFDGGIIIGSQYAGVTSYSSDGTLNSNFGLNGHIQNPFLGSSSDILSDAFIIDDKLMLIGCSTGESTIGYDVYARQFDLITGMPIDGTTYTEPDPTDDEYLGHFIDDNSLVSLFGLSSADGIRMIHNNYDSGSKVYSDLTFYGDYIPVKFQQLSDGKIVGSFFQGGIKIFDNIEQVFDQDTEIIESTGSIRDDFIELDEELLINLDNSSSNLFLLNRSDEMLSLIHI